MVFALRKPVHFHQLHQQRRLTPTAVLISAHTARIRPMPVRMPSTSCVRLSTFFSRAVTRYTGHYREWGPLRFQRHPADQLADQEFAVPGRLEGVHQARPYAACHAGCRGRVGQGGAHSPSASCRRSRSASTSAADRAVVVPAHKAAERRCSSSIKSLPATVERSPGPGESWGSGAKLCSNTDATKARSSGDSPNACCTISSRPIMMGAPALIRLFPAGNS